MVVRRIRRVVGLASLFAVSSCVLISGVSELEVDDDPRVDGGVATSSASSSGATSGDPADGGSFPFPFDASFLDGFGFFDGNFPDVELPDTGGPESGPAGSGVVQCSGSLQCSNGQACCYSVFAGAPSCAATAEACPAKNGLRCDDDTDCQSGKICCIAQDIFAYTATSSCVDTCGVGMGNRACRTDDDCASSGPGSNCRHVQLAPNPIKACQ